MTKRKKIILSIIILFLVGAVGMPVINLVVKPQRPPLAQAKLQEPLFKVAGPVLQEKCADCHAKHPALPWYASLPIASQMIQYDIIEGLKAFDMDDALFSDTKELSEIGLAKLESSTNRNQMPPARYLLMHWDYALSKSDEQNIMAWIKHVRKQQYAPEDVAEESMGEPVWPLPQTVAVNQDKAALGDKLFHDKRLSGDNTLSCASCHALDKGGTDQLQFSVGINKAVGGINSPTVYNSSYNFLQFWDGRAKDLAEQADGPVNNPIEMGSNWEQAIAKIKDDGYYKQAFAQLYDGDMTEKNIRDAIATFESTLITPNCKFDKYLRGDSAAMSADEIQGYRLFVQEGCTSCHLSTILGGTHFEKMGKERDYFAARGNVTEADYGRFNVTKKEEDRYKFKVPTLRNIAVTHPYLHDGTVTSISKTIELMGEYQLGENLSADKVQLMEKFLLTLTGEYKGVLLK